MAKESSLDMARHFGTLGLLRYALPSIAMVIFTSVYGIVDGLFVSNFAGSTAFAAVNLIMPVIMILSSVGFMTGSGGSAYVSILRGDGQEEQANRAFSLIVYFTAGVGVVMAVVGVLSCRTVCAALGATGDLLEESTLYGTLIYLSLPGYVLQCTFQSMTMAAGKPKLGLGFTVASGLANIILDFVLVGLCGMGIVGAALATNVSEWLGGLAPLVYFARPNSSYFRLGKTPFSGKVIAKVCVNGSSEMMENLVVSLVSVIYNWQLLALVGENGVAAYGVIMYVFMIFAASFMGYGMATSPLMGYQYGARNHVEMHSIFVKSLRIIGVSGVLMFGLSQLLAGPIAMAFCGYDVELCAYTEHAFRIFYLCFLFVGFNMYGSALFTALGNGLVSAVISFVRTMICEAGCVLALPLLFGPESLWYACLVAEILCIILVSGCMAYFAPIYGYGREKGTKKQAH